jgi:succinate dehydrogenase/fumarate reductase cytochrome b subunit
MNDPEDSDTSAATLDDKPKTPPEALVMLVATLAFLAICVGGFALIFWQSDQEYGGLPSASGSGLLIYGGAAAGVALAAAVAGWGYHQWRGSKGGRTR